MRDSGNLSESLEDYLEAIFHIVAEKNAARAKDIADRVGVTSASVTGALRSLEKRGLVNHEPYDIVTLTEKGESLAAGIVRRHETLRDFFVKVLSVDEAEAEECACKMEHAVPDNVLERFLAFLEVVEERPLEVADWIGKQAEGG